MLLRANDHSVDKFQEWNVLHKNPSSRNQVDENDRSGLPARINLSIPIPGKQSLLTRLQ